MFLETTAMSFPMCRNKPDC